MELSRQNPADPEVPQANETPDKIRKRMLGLSLMLGMMFGVGMFVFVVAIAKQRPSLIAVGLLMFVIAIPMASTFVQLRKELNQQPPASP